MMKTQIEKNLPVPIQQMIAKYPRLLEKGAVRMLWSKDGSYHSVFNYYNGMFGRCGKTLDKDPKYSKLGPEILDLEISEVCHGIDGKVCPFCYKSNNGNGKNMSFETFKKVFHAMPRNLTQIALGIGDIDGNPDLWKIMEYCRNNKYNYVIPNITINGWNLTDDYADRFASVLGAMAISHYDDDICFNAVNKMTDRIGKNKNTIQQVNIHQLVAEETFDECMDLLKRAKTDPRLEKLNAIVFLALKQKGRGRGWKPLAQEKYKQIIDYAFDHNIAIGFDSCSSYKFLKSVEKHDRFGSFCEMAEPCESSLFSSYINVDGLFFPCSFTEGEEGYEADTGLDVANCDDFLKDIWYHPKTVEFRKKLMHTATQNKLKCRTCPIFNV